MIASITPLSVVSLERAESERREREQSQRERERYTQRSTVKERERAESHTAGTEIHTAIHTCMQHMHPHSCSSTHLHIQIPEAMWVEPT